MLERACVLRTNEINDDPVPVGETGVLDDGYDVWTFLRQRHEIPAGAVGELDGVDDAGWADDVRDVGDGGAGCGAEVEDLDVWGGCVSLGIADGD